MILAQAQNRPAAFSPTFKDAAKTSSNVLLAPGDAYVPSSPSTLSLVTSGAVIGGALGLLTNQGTGLTRAAAGLALSAAGGYGIAKGFDVVLKDRGFSDHKQGGIIAGAWLGIYSAVASCVPMTTVEGAVIHGLVGALGGAGLAYGLSHKE